MTRAFTFLMLLTAASAPLATAETVESPTHACSGDVDHACIQCPAHTTWNGSQCTWTDAQGVEHSEASQTCAVYSNGACWG